MRHSTQMRQELNSIWERAGAFHNQAFSNFPESYHRALILHRQELMEYKVKLEELFEETDNKEQSIKNVFLMFFKSIFLFGLLSRKSKNIHCMFCWMLRTYYRKDALMTTKDMQIWD